MPDPRPPPSSTCAPCSSAFTSCAPAWLYARGGGAADGAAPVTLSTKIIAAADKHGALRVVTDEVSSPTYAPDLAAAIAQLIHTGHYGIFHLTNSGICSRYEWACKILELSGRGHVPVEPITTDQWQRAAPPPLYAPLVNFAGAALGITLRPWEEALREYFRGRESGIRVQGIGQHPDSRFPDSLIPDSPLASVVIPNWNGLQHLPVCLDALRAQTYPHLEVILVDNGSTDGSQAFVTEQYPEVRLLALDRNLGLTGGNNAGFRAAQGEILISLNNDTEADPRFVEALVAALVDHPEAGMAAAKMLLFDRRDVIHSAGDGYGADGIPFNRGVWQRDEGQFDEPGWIFGGCGGAVAYRRAMLDRDRSVRRILLHVLRGRGPQLAGAVGRLELLVHARGGGLSQAQRHRRRPHRQLLHRAEHAVGHCQELSGGSVAPALAARARRPVGA